MTLRDLLIIGVVVAIVLIATVLQRSPHVQGQWARVRPAVHDVVMVLILVLLVLLYLRVGVPDVRSILPR